MKNVPPAEELSEHTSWQDPVQQLWEQWQRGQKVSLHDYLKQAGSLTPVQLKSVVRVDQQERWRHGERVPVESYLRDQPELLADEEAVIDLIHGEILMRESRGEAPKLDEYVKRFPQYAEPMRRQFNLMRTLDGSSLISSGNGGAADSQVTQAGELPAAPTDPTLTHMLEGGAPRQDRADAPTMTTPEQQRSGDSTFQGQDIRRDARGRPLVEGYEIIEELGRGGMGVVYKARQTKLKRVVALKMVLAGAHASAMELARFRSEAESVARLQHPNIVQIYEVGEQNGCPFFSLEFIDGGTLVQRLGEPMAEREALGIIEKLARAIHVAHLRGIVHRDLKPANVLLTSDGAPKLTDFGLAKRLDDEAKDKGVTRTGAIMGTPSYMAPEQATGKIHEIGPPTDIYALGAMLYELLTGRPPFKGSTLLDTLELLRTQEPAAPRSLQAKINRDAETICLKCLEKDPQKRYISAEALADDLHSFLVGEPIKARPTPAWERAWKWAKRRPALVSLLGVILAACLGVLALSVYHYFDLQRQVDKARQDVTDAQRGQLRAEVQELIQKGETAIAAQNWQEAERFFNAASTKVGTEEHLPDLKTQIGDLLEQIRPKLLDQEGYRNARSKYGQFKTLHGDAMFHGSLFTGSDAASSRAAARTSAEKALDLFGIHLDNAGPPKVDARFFNDVEKTDIISKCYELALIVADSAAGNSAPKAAEEALRILDGAARIGFPVGKAYHLRRARYLDMQGNAAAAAKEREQAEPLKPTVALGYFWLGDEMFKQGNLAQASLEFENALRLQPDHFWAQYMLAVCQLRMQRPAQAKASLTACLSLRPDFVWAYSLRGFAHGELAEYDAALADFQKGLDSNPDAMTRYGIHVNRGVMRMRQGQMAEAVTDLRRAIELKPKQYQAHVNLAEALQKENKLDEALSEFDQAIQLAPGNGSLYRNRARLQLLRHDDPAALRDLDQAIALEAKDSAALALVEDYVERGRILYRAKSYQEAAQSCDQAIKISPDFAPAHRLRAELLLELKDYKGAVQEFDVYLKTEKADAGIHQGRALARAKMGNYPGAIEDYTRALALKPDSYSYAGRGWAYVASNSLKLALPDFDEALKLDAANSYAYSGRGYVRVKLGQVRQGIADAEDALRQGAESPGLMNNVARTYAQAVGKLDEEAKVRQLNAQTLELRFQYQDHALRLLRKLLDKLPRKEQAAFWNKYVRTDPDLEPIRRAPGFVQLDNEFAK